MVRRRVGFYGSAVYNRRIIALIDRIRTKASEDLYVLGG
jgi:hypothetical protein